MGWAIVNQQVAGIRVGRIYQKNKMHVLRLGLFRGRPPCGCSKSDKLYNKETTTSSFMMLLMSSPLASPALSREKDFAINEKHNVRSRRTTFKTRTA